MVLFAVVEMTFAPCLKGNNSVIIDVHISCFTPPPYYFAYIFPPTYAYRMLMLQEQENKTLKGMQLHGSALIADTQSHSKVYTL